VNKYYIGYPLPEDLRHTMKGLQHQVVGAEHMEPIEQLHVTALYLGAMPRDEAVRVFQGLGRRTLPILSALDTYQRFGNGNALVVTLQQNQALVEVNAELSRLAGKPIMTYNPHITIAKGKKAFIKMGCPEKSFALNSIALFEKMEGGEYHVHMLTRFQ